MDRLASTGFPAGFFGDYLGLCHPTPSIVCIDGPRYYALALFPRCYAQGSRRNCEESVGSGGGSVKASSSFYIRGKKQRQLRMLQYPSLEKAKDIFIVSLSISYKRYLCRVNSMNIRQAHVPRSSTHTGEERTHHSPNNTTDATQT